MLDTKVREELKKILQKCGNDAEILANRKLSSKHIDETEVLLRHVSIMVEYLLLDSQASRSELFDMRKLVEDEGDSQYGF
jgi:hypothetical protein